MNAAVRTRTCKPRTSRTSGVSGTPGTLCSHDKMAQHADKPGTTYKQYMLQAYQVHQK